MWWSPELRSNSVLVSLALLAGCAPAARVSAPSPEVPVEAPMTRSTVQPAHSRYRLVSVEVFGSRRYSREEVLTVFGVPEGRDVEQLSELRREAKQGMERLLSRFAFAKVSVGITNYEDTHTVEVMVSLVDVGDEWRPVGEGPQPAACGAEGRGASAAGDGGHAAVDGPGRGPACLTCAGGARPGQRAAGVEGVGGGVPRQSWGRGGGPEVSSRSETTKGQCHTSCGTALESLAAYLVRTPRRTPRPSPRPRRRPPGTRTRGARRSW
jgi:hypothetical protein